MKFRVLTAAAALTVTALFSTSSWAGEPVDQATMDKLRATLEVPSMGLQVESASQSEIPGILEVQFINGPLVYTSVKGDFFIMGDLFSVGPTGYVNLAEKRRDGDRQEQIAAIPISEMIVFSPQGETLASVTVFTDVSCYYCQKLHKEVPELNKRGVEVRYLGYPRAGVGSEAYRQLASARCDANPQETLTKLKNRETVADNVCPDNPIAQQYELGQQLGVRGTPAIITESGQMIPGYQSADDLMVTLGLN